MPRWIYLITASEIREFVQNKKRFLERKIKKDKPPRTKEDVLIEANRKLLKNYKKVEFSYLSNKEKKLSDSKLEEMLKNYRDFVIANTLYELKSKIEKYNIDRSLTEKKFSEILDEIIPKRIDIINEKKDIEIVLEVMDGDKLPRPFMNREIGICARPDFTIIKKYMGDVSAIPYEVKPSNPPSRRSCTYPVYCQLAADRLAITSMRKKTYSNLTFPYYGMVFYIDGSERKVNISKNMDDEIIKIATEIRKLSSILE